MRELKNKEV
jgi:chromosome segregation ATPase